LTIRRLSPGDEEIVVQLGGERPLTHAQATDLVADERTIYLVAFDRQEPVGYVFAHQLPRRGGDPSHLFLYDLEVKEALRRRGIATALMRELEQISREHGIRTGFVLTNSSNDPAMSLYRSLGGTRPNEDDAMWQFDYPA
jgi:ribosomal protein S18 acetylase RimI-like enzyme